jgi:hypothetical protein
MPNCVDLSIVGAGAYGLSLASYVNRSAIRLRIFGSAFNAWRSQMPSEMILKSTGFSSNISDPDGKFTLKKFCADRQIPYADEDLPIHIKDFCAYGVEFQRTLVPQLEDRQIVSLKQTANGFLLVTEDGEEVTARKVVLATGTSNYEYIPPELKHLPRSLVTHSAGHRDFEPFRGRKLVVLGRGASAVNAAAFACAAGADVELFSRKTVEFDEIPSGKTPPWHRPLLNPRTSLGPGWISMFLERTPWAFRLLPADLRLYVVKRKLGPAAGSYIRIIAEDKFPIHTPAYLQSAAEEGGRVALVFKNESGVERKVVADHVICGTGFHVDPASLPYLDRTLVKQIRTIDGSPVLSANFESSVPGLYFTGLPAAATFGPLLRFVHGTEFTSRTIDRHLRKCFMADLRSRNLAALEGNPAT